MNPTTRPKEATMTSEPKIRTRTPLSGGAYELEYDNGTVERFTANGTSMAVGNALPGGGFELKYRDGTIRRFNADGRLHSFDDEPAVVFTDGHMAWYRDGLKHRDDDEPAEVWGRGDKAWFQDGVPHRGGDKPAVVHPNGDMSWFLKGRPHRVGGPATIKTRYNPAVIWPRYDRVRGYCWFFLNGEEVTEAEAMAAAQPDLPEAPLASPPGGPIQVAGHVSRTKTGEPTVVKAHTRKRPR